MFFSLDTNSFDVLQIIINMELIITMIILLIITVLYSDFGGISIKPSSEVFSVLIFFFLSVKPQQTQRENHGPLDGTFRFHSILPIISGVATFKVNVQITDRPDALLKGRSAGPAFVGGGGADLF